MDISELNDEQKLAVLHKPGSPAAVIAGAGSGKTKVLTTRIGYLVEDEGVIPKRVLALTFTNKAANEIKERLGMTDEHNCPRVGTIHSLALSAIRKAPKGFGLGDRVTPLDDYDQTQMLKRLIEAEKLEEQINVYLLKEKIGYHRARGVGFVSDYTADVAAIAAISHGGYHRLLPEELDIWATYEKEKSKNSVVDFDDMIHLVVRRGKTDDRWLGNLQHQFDFVLMDEAQDTNTCHPPGTMVRKVTGPATRRGVSHGWTEVPIETLKNGDRVVPWERGHGKLLLQGAEVTVGVRNYSGDLLSITCGNNVVQMTPDHRVYAALNDTEAYAVYLMWRRDLGYRVGQCALKYRRKGAGPYGGFIARVQEEKAEKAWLLKVVATKHESRAWEQIVSCNYGIPTTQFESSDGERHEELIHLVFSKTSGAGNQCLMDHGRMLDYPLYSREETTVHKRWMEVRAVNLIPGLMSLPSTERGKRVAIDEVKRTPYSGPVYSMNVEKYHTYVANGIIVKNCQWDFINMLLPPDNLNMLCVGDVSQCQPPGTMVKVVTVPATNHNAAICEDRAIESLQDGDLVTAWSRRDQITYSAGRSIRVAKRPYAGSLVKIHTVVGKTECTPNHWNWVRFNKSTEGKYLVYLMFRKDLGFRVGLSIFKRATTGDKKSAYGLSTRMNQEGAEKAWVLKVLNTRAEAEAWEEIYSLKYGIPESLFESTPCRNKTAELIKLIFSHANPEGGRRCLTDHGLLEDYPITQRGVNGCRQSWRGYFKTATANIIPEIMDIPIGGRNKSTRVTGMTTRYYEGLVYSLDVEKDHTYIADGLVVGNSIYGFNGAEPAILLNYTKNWRGVQPTTYKLQRNHRSVPEVVKLANKIQLFMSDTIPLKMESYRGDAKNEHGKILLRRGATPRELATAAAEEIVNRAQGIQYRDISILVRAGSQVRDIETELVRLRIPYIIRGTMGLLQTEEVKDILSYMKLASNPNDFSAMCRSISIPRRGIGEAALKALHRDSAQYDGDLIQTLKSRNAQKLNGYVTILETLQDKSKDPFAAIDYLLAATRYEEFIKTKYKKYPDRIEVKQLNIQRLKELIDSLMSERAMTIEDVVFQLTMQDQKDDVNKGGKVVISTIHAAKGLEWKIVYVMGVVEGILPHKWSSSDAEVEEERRIFYVACTRARDRLIICVPSSLEYPGRGAQFVAPSRFLTELGVCE